ncbi:SubName: Full=Uncharacterized protein {ECO:0000313/EMBL:CCA77936.1} [Serendipita indica DSM 11827]|uniref:Chalcone isomerase domain-containing protein n=1 Tax=Serendipita indica (strain DSM 11827) TaxID=1109443 RepID=G4U2Y8_SERID|nr:SubName: Full=Uncharacterized protein {ECO:0000313/EMBL:CCA77936.1} [Serendipita indica DSM 11827]CCA77936.1 hypothetical protein PIIN_00650 [Serendipita indica DSM 11827]
MSTPTRLFCVARRAKTWNSRVTSHSSARSALFATNQRRNISQYNDQGPYDPDEDKTPRRRYVFGGAIVIGVLAAVATSLAGRKSRLDQVPAEFEKDPATDVQFPTTLQLPGTPPLTLLGLGVRTVSILGLKVYSVGFYADIQQPGFQPRLDGTPEEQIEHIVRNTTCALRIVPVRSTSHTHLRDGFVRAVQSRITLARQQGLLTTEQEDALLQPVQTMKGLFPNVSLPKHQPLHVVLTSPNRNGTRTLYFPELGRVDDPWLANEFFLAYFAGKGISPAMKKSVEDTIEKITSQR